MNDRVNTFERSILFECLNVDVLIYELAATYIHACHFIPAAQE